MSYNQLYVTSCPRGVTGSSGFQTMAMSPDIQPAERAQIESLVGYVKPSGSPDNPTPEQLATEYPMNFGYCVLASGRWCLFQSVYVHHDHTGTRGGNYFAHAIVGSMGEMHGLPTDYWRSPTFRQSATEVLQRVKDGGDHTLPLLAQIEPGSPGAASEGHASIVRDLITAACSSRKSGRRAVLAAAPETAVAWVAAVLRALPLPWAREISFGTYTRDPLKTNLHFVAVQRGQGVFGFTNADRDYTSYVFDFERSSYSKLPEDMEWRRDGSLDSLAERTQLPQSESEMRGALAFAAMVGLSKHPDGPALNHMTAFLKSRARPGELAALHQLWVGQKDLADAITSEDAPAHLRGLLELAGQTGEDKSLTATAQLLRWLLQRQVFDDHTPWRALLSAALDPACGDPKKLALLVLNKNFVETASAFVSDAQVPKPAVVEACAVLVQLLDASKAGEPLRTQIVETVAHALPVIVQQGGALAQVLAVAPPDFIGQVLAVGIEQDALSFTSLAHEVSPFLGNAPFEGMADLVSRSSLLARSKMLPTLLHAIAARELEGDQAVKRYERIVKVMQTKPDALHLGLVQPRLFALITQRTPDRLPEVCRDFLLNPPGSNVELTPVLDMLEQHLSLAAPPKWLAGKTLGKLYALRKAHPPEGVVSPVLACLHVAASLKNAVPMGEVMRQMPNLGDMAAELPAAAWEAFAQAAAEAFATQRAAAAEAATFLNEVGGSDAQRHGRLVSWTASAQLPGMLGGGNLQGLVALLQAAFGYKWDPPIKKALIESLGLIISQAREGTINHLHGASIDSRIPAFMRFMNELPESGGVVSKLLRRFTGQ